MIQTKDKRKKKKEMEKAGGLVWVSCSKIKTWVLEPFFFSRSFFSDQKKKKIKLKKIPWE